MKNNIRNKEGSVMLLVVVAIIVVVGGALVLTKGNIPGLQSQPVSVSSETDIPTNLVVAGELTPGSRVELVLEKLEEKTAKLESVKLEKEGYVYVYKGGHGGAEKVLLGKSELLEVGTHSNVVINLSLPAKAGDVIVISLQDMSGYSME